MLGFLKKKKKDPDAPDQKAGAKAKDKDKKDPSGPTDPAALEPDAKAGKKKKRFSIKKLVFIVLILGVLGGGGYFAYSRFFGASESGTAARIYTPVDLAHIKLPPEMLAFSFNQFPDLYGALVALNKEVTLFEAEIERIEAIGTQYPDQKKIVDSQKKVWEKGKTTVLKTVSKLEKPIKETFVLYQVNKTRGLEQIQAKTEDLTATAQDALKVAREQTAELKDRLPKPPEGMVQGLLYKIKKIFQ